MKRALLVLSCAFCVGHWLPAAAQQLLDRIAATVNGTVITLTDVQAARALGVVNAPDDAAAVQPMIDRQLSLIEVARFPPAEPDKAAVDAEVARERAAAGAALPSIMQATGLDDTGIRAMARDTLRIRAYLDQRFGTAGQVTDDEAELYYDEHPDEFRRDGVVVPFETALPVARERANAERRKQQVDRWLQDLRNRATIAIPAP
jgi:hypothetical protein